MRNSRIVLNILSLIIISLFSVSVFAQELHRTGLIEEDLTKVSWIKEYKSLEKITNLPKSVDLSEYMPPVGDQGNQGSCMGWSFGYYCKTYQESVERGWDINDLAHRFSPSFIYTQTNGGVDSGASTSAVAALLLRSGCAPYSDYPYDDKEYQKLPSEKAYDDAINYRSDAAYIINVRTDAGITQVKKLLAEKQPCVLLIRVYPNFDKLNLFHYVYCAKNKMGASRGGHGIALIGYDDSLKTNDGYGAFKFINSWGTSFGQNGFAYVSYEAMKDLDLTQGVVAFVTDKIEYKPLLKAKVKLTHSSRGNLSLQFGVGSTLSPTASLDFSVPTRSYLNLPASDQSVIVDLTDFYKILKTGQSNKLNLKCTDSKADGYSGTIDSLSIIDIIDNQTIQSTETPAAISDKGSKTLTLSLTPQTIFSNITLSSPTNGAEEISDEPVLSWTGSGLGTYKVQVSTNNIDFENNIVFSQNLISSTSIKLPEMLRNKIYFWRVANDNYENWSDLWSFKTTILNSRIGFAAETANYNWIDISQTGTVISNWVNIDKNGKYWNTTTNRVVLDDGFTESRIPIGFNFNFYGNNYDSLYVGINGLVSFTHKILNMAYIDGYTAAPNYLGAFNDSFFPPGDNAFPRSIAVAYNDFDLDITDGYGNGKVLYQTVGDKFILSWLDVGTFVTAGDINNSFQLILDKTNKITMQYKSFGQTTTINNLIIGLQNCDTAAVMWVSKALPVEHKVGNGKAIVFNPVISPSSIDARTETPASFVLMQNYPNPFNPSTKISYYLPSSSIVKVTIYNLLGQEITQLINKEQVAGYHNVSWNAINYPSGMYIYKVEASSLDGKDNFKTAKKMLLVK